MDTLILQHLKLRNFRSHKSLDLDFSSKFVYLSGPNGVGKTNILEAISLFSPGRGLRGANISDLTQINSEKFWNLSSVFKISNIFAEIEIGLDNKGKKILRVDGKKKPLIYLTEILKNISFKQAVKSTNLLGKIPQNLIFKVNILYSSIAPTSGVKA